jgi:hypothetical protein
MPYSFDLASVMYWIFVLGLLLSIGIGLYGAYWSFAIRRSLRVRIYRRQASIMSVFALFGIVLIFLYYFVYFFVPSLTNTAAGFVQSIGYIIFLVIVLVWVDISIRVGRRSDPLLRDPLRWTGYLRWIVWTLMGISLIILIVPTGGNIAHNFGSTLTSLGFVMVFITLGVAIIPAFVAAKRSGDRFYRTSLKWFGVGVFLLVLQNIGFTLIYVGTGITYNPGNFAWALVSNFYLLPFVFYSLYRCTRSLVPLNRIELSSA